MNDPAQRGKNMAEFAEDLKLLNLEEIRPLSGDEFCNSVKSLIELTSEISKKYEELEK